MPSNNSNNSTTAQTPEAPENKPSWFNKAIQAIAANNLHRNTQTHRNAVRRWHAENAGLDPANEPMELDPMHIGDNHNYPPQKPPATNGLAKLAAVGLLAATGGAALPIVGPALMDYYQAKPQPQIERDVPSDDDRIYGLNISVGKDGGE